MQTPTLIPVGNLGFVELIDHMGSDLSPVNAARISLGKRSTEFSPADESLLHYLADNEHTSPFRHAFLTLHFKTPIFVARQIMKHQVGCLTGDTDIHFERLTSHAVKGGVKKVSLETLYNQWHEGRTNAWFKSGKQPSAKMINQRHVRCFDETTGTFTTNHISDVLFQGEKPVYLVRLEGGYTIKMTADHKVMTPGGWMPLEKCVNDITNPTAMLHPVMVNGMVVVGNGRYRDVAYLQQAFLDGKTVEFMANECGCSREAVKKWCYKLGIQFNKTTAKFEKGCQVWNMGKTYALPHTWGRKHGGVVRTGAESHAWKGGVASDERAKIGSWTSAQARRVHLKFQYRCAKCGGNENLETHHKLPVHSYPEHAYDLEMLTSVCQECHDWIHASPENEAEFAQADLELLKKSWKERSAKPRVGNRLLPKFATILEITPAGTQKVYDLVMENPLNPNFIANGVVVHNCTVNEISGRYVEFKETDYWVPMDGMRASAAHIKQGSAGTYIPRSTEAIDLLDRACYDAFQTYEQLLGMGVCREQARAVLPVGTYTEFYMSGSVQAWAHFCNLRLDAHAQKETRDFATVVYGFLHQLFPVSTDVLVIVKHEAD